jgi:hypothetical protein
LSTETLSVVSDSVPGGEACLTIAEPNRNLNSAIGVTLVDESGAVDSSLATGTNGEHASNLTVMLQPGKPRWLVAGVHICCKGCDATGTPRCVMPTTPSCGPPNTCLPQNNGAVAAALATAASVSKQVAAEQHATLHWWDAYWNASSIDLGPKYRQLEQFYYGLQYTVGAASRAGRMAPGLWGPWITTDGAGWNGDYTINYNFQAIYYGVFSDNRPELALPYFPVIEQMTELGKWRTSVDWLPRAVS